MKATEDRMRALGLLTPMSVLTLDEWEIPRDRVVINRKLGEGAFGTVYGGESFFDEKGWVRIAFIWSLSSGGLWRCFHQILYILVSFESLMEYPFIERFPYENRPA